MIWRVAILFICFGYSVRGEKLHEHMTPEEIESIFHVKHHEMKDLEYEVVKVFHVEKESLRELGGLTPQIHLRAFNKNFSLYLEENNHVLLGENTPLFEARPTSYRSRRFNVLDDYSDIEYRRMQYPLPENFKLYHDMNNRAALTLHKTDDNKVHVDGVIGDEVVIRALPERVHKEVLGMNPSFTGAQGPLDNLDSIFNSDPFSRGNVGYDPLPQGIFGGNTLPQGNFGDNPFPQGNFGNDPFSLGNLGNDPFSLGNFQPTHHVVIKPNIPFNPPFVPIDPLPYNNPNYQPPQPFPWNPVTRDPFPWRPATIEPFTLPPITREPALKPTRPSVSIPVDGTSDTVYPELLITVDYETYKVHGSDIQTVSKYMAAFWNAVDLRYRELKNPSVRLNIAGLIIPTQSSGASYMERNLGDKVDSLFAGQTLSEIARYFFKQENTFPNIPYDIVVGITHRNLGDYDNNIFSDHITGIAFGSGACNKVRGISAALVRDKGGFNGITTAAHELAHTMGAPHDGVESANVPGGPCGDGYLMSYNRTDAKGMHWSQCSQTAMKNFLQSPSAQCLRLKPYVGKPYSKILPGQLLSRDEQCQRSLGFGWNSHKDGENNCAVLLCTGYIGADLYVRTEYRPPAEGSPCGEGAICLNAECVRNPEISRSN